MNGATTIHKGRDWQTGEMGWLINWGFSAKLRGTRSWYRSLALAQEAMRLCLDAR